jgi:hypothetical protein
MTSESKVEPKESETKTETTPDLMGKIKEVEEVAHDSSPAIIRDHKFRPKGAWYTLCEICNFAESAHEASELQYYIDDDNHWAATWDDD